MQALNVTEFKKLVDDRCTVIDNRKPEKLIQGFIKGSIAVHSFAMVKEYLGVFSDFDFKAGHNAAALVFDDVQPEAWAQDIEKLGIPIGAFLQDGFAAWARAGLPVDMIIDVEADELIMDIQFDKNIIVMDIRSLVSYSNGHLKDAINLPLLNVVDPLRLAAIEDTDNIYIVGNDTEDAIFAATLLKRQDIHNLRVVNGGWPALEQQPKAKIVKEPSLLN